MLMPPTPSRGEIWLVDLNPTRDHEQAGMRPVLIVSTNPFNHGPADLVIVAPLTTTARPMPLRVRLDPPAGGLRSTSYVLCDAVRSISKDRLVTRWGSIAREPLAQVEDYLRILLEL
jgi:mRNA interferase MazF